MSIVSGHWKWTKTSQEQNLKLILVQLHKKVSMELTGPLNDHLVF